jgi:hypothetical protein
MDLQLHQEILEHASKDASMVSMQYGWKRLSGIKTVAREGTHWLGYLDSV